MLRLKKLDAFGQMLAIAAFALVTLLRRDAGFLYGYFVVGAWQTISMVLHIARAGHMPLHVARNFYQKMVACLALLGIVAFVTGFSDWYFLFLLYFSPIIAIWYTWISFREYSVWEAKSLVHLKN